MILATVAVLAALPLLAAQAAPTASEAIASGAAYIKSLQQADGSYGSNSLSQNMDAVFAVRAAGFDPAKDKVGGVGPADFVVANVGQVTNPAIAAKAALVAKALGLNPHAVGGVNLIAIAEAGFDSASGLYGADAFSQSVAMIGLACTGEKVPGKASTALVGQQLAESGGWGFSGLADPDTTAIAVQALLATGASTSDAAVTKALAYFKASQGLDGGWGFDPSESNASSTAYVVQALLAAGKAADSAEYQVNGVSPIEYLLSQQLPDGSFKGFDPAYSTNQVLPALARRTFCDAAQAPIVNLRPAPTATPASPTPTSAPSVVPAPPSTGTGPARGATDHSGVLFGAALVAAAIGLTGTAAIRRRG